MVCGGLQLQISTEGVDQRYHGVQLLLVRMDIRCSEGMTGRDGWRSIASFAKWEDSWRLIW